LFVFLSLRIPLLRRGHVSCDRHWASHHCSHYDCGLDGSCDANHGLFDCLVFRMRRCKHRVRFCQLCATRQVCFMVYLKPTTFFTRAQVLGSNFQYEYEANEEDEKQRKRDIFTSISVGLTEYRRICEVRVHSKVVSTYSTSGYRWALWVVCRINMCACVRAVWLFMCERVYFFVF
jgi:hypothetical protein